MLDIKKIREDFGQTPDVAWFCSAGSSFMPRSIFQATMDAYLQLQANSYKGDSGYENRMHEAWLDAVTALLNCEREEIAGIVCTTHGLNIAAYGIDLKSDENVITTGVEYFTIPTAVYYQSKLTGCEVRVAERDGYTIPPENIEKLIDKKTRAIFISLVEFINGFRNDLEQLSRLAHDHKVLLVVDAIQSLGILPVDVKKLGIDILTSGAHKWLNSFGGYGILYVKKELIPQLRSPYMGHFGLANRLEPVRDYEKSFDCVRDYLVNENNIRKFEFSTENFVGKVALTKMIQYLLDIGVDVIEKRIMFLLDYLIDRLHKKGIEIHSSLKPEHRSGIINFAPEGDVGEIVKNLRSKGIFTQYRGGGIRVAVNFYNTEDEIDRLVREL